YEAFYFDDDHIEKISSGSTTTHSDISLSEYDSFTFDLSNDQCPPTDRSDLTHEEFVDELAHIISPPEYDCFYFRNLPYLGELISILNSGIHENLSTTRVNLPVEDDYSPLLAYVVWIFLAYLTYPVIPPYLHSFGNEDTIFDPGITINRVYSFNPGLSHRLLHLAGSQPMLKSSYKAEDGVIISIPPLVGGVADVMVEIKGTGYQMRLESLEARIVVHEKNEAVYEEDIAFLKYDVQVKDISIKEIKNQLEDALKEKDDLKLKLEKFETFSKNLTKLINSQISAIDMTGLGCDSQINESDLNDIHVNESKVLNNVVDSRESTRDDNQVNDWFKKGEGYHAVLPPYNGNYMPPRADLSFVGLDNSIFKSKVSKTITSVPKIETNASKNYKDSLEKPKTVRSSAPLIEEWKSDSEDKHVFKPKEVKKTVKPSLEKIEFVNARNTTVENENKAEKLRKFRKITGPKEIRLVWDNTARVNHQNKLTHPHPERNFVPGAVITKYGQVPVNAAKQSSHRAATSISVATCVNTAASRTNLNNALPRTYSYFKAHSLVRRPFNQKSSTKTNNFSEKVNTAKVNNVTTVGPKAVVSAVEGNPQYALQDQGIFDSGCSRHMTVKNVNEEAHIQTLVDKKKVIITEASIRRDLRKQKSKRKQRKEIKVPLPSSEIPNEERLPITSNDPLPSGEDRMQLNELMILCTNLQKQVLNLEEAKIAQAKEIASLKKREDTSKQGRMIDNIDQDVEITLVDDNQGRINKEDMFGVNDLNGNEVVVDVSASEKVEKSVKVVEKEVSTADPVTTVGEVVTTAGIEVTNVATTPKISKDELTLAQTLIKIKPAKPKAIITIATIVIAADTRPKAKGIVMQEPSERPTPTPIDSSQQSSKAKDKGKAETIEHEKPLKRKEQIMIDEEVARNLKAQMQVDLEEKERLARQKEKEANIALVAKWDNIHAMMDVDYELAAILQEEERGELSIEEKSRLFMELMDKRKKHFARLRAKKIRRKPPTKAQKRNQMCTYLKNMANYKHNQLKNKSFEEIQIEKAVEGSEKAKENSSKRAGSTLEQEDAKRQMIEEENEYAELKKCLEIILEDDDDVTIKATPLSSKSSTIVDYKIYKEGRESFFKITRADGNSQSYLTFGKMFKNFNRKDLEVLWSIVKARFKKIKPTHDMDNLLFQTLKTMFEHHVEDNIWKYQQGTAKVLHWKLFDSCGVYCVTTQNMVYYLLVEKMYPFTRKFLHQMCNDVRLQVDYEVEMAYELLRLIRM
nr:hypothetical protein [Tanacetum cinerariifolium]